MLAEEVGQEGSVLGPPSIVEVGPISNNRICTLWPSTVVVGHKRKTPNTSFRRQRA